MISGGTGGALPGASGWLNRLDPRCRIGGAVAVALCTVALNDLPPLLAALAVSLCMAATAQLPWRALLKRVAAVDGFIIVMLLMLPFTHPGTPLFTLLGFTGSAEGTRQAVTIGLKAQVIMLVLIPWVGTLEPVILGQALQQLKIPARLTHLLLFTVRYIAVLDREYHRLRLAMRMRGFRPKTDLHSWRSFAYLFGMLLVRSHDRAERVLSAMKCRGYRGRFPICKGGALTAADRLFVITLTGLLSALIAAEWLL